MLVPTLQYHSAIGHSFFLPFFYRSIDFLLPPYLKMEKNRPITHPNRSADFIPLYLFLWVRLENIFYKVRPIILRGIHRAIIIANGMVQVFFYNIRNNCYTFEIIPHFIRCRGSGRYMYMYTWSIVLQLLGSFNWIMHMKMRRRIFLIKCSYQELGVLIYRV